MSEREIAKPSIIYTASQGFVSWLAALRGSLALTTYQAGRLLILGSDSSGQMNSFEREFVRPMGLSLRPDGSGFVMASQHQIHSFDDIAHTGYALAAGMDACFSPHASWITGSIDAHDVGIDNNGTPIFVSTAYSCIAAVSDRYSFRPIWRPRFISALELEDRCHLNGMAMEDGRPMWATAISTSDSKEGWRDHRAGGGVLIDITSSEIAVRGLSMPHSPRLSDGKLWLLNSGAGQFGHVDAITGKFESIAFCPGYARGLALIGKYAVIGLSMPRDGSAFSGLPLDDELALRKQNPFCGLLVIDTGTGRIVEWLRLDGPITELYDIMFIPDVRSASVIGFRTDEVKHAISIENGGSTAES